MANHDNMGPEEPGKQPEVEEIKLWNKKKPDTRKKKSYIYEVPSSEPESEPDPDPVIWNGEKKNTPYKHRSSLYETIKTQNQKSSEDVQEQPAEDTSSADFGQKEAQPVSERELDQKSIKLDSVEHRKTPKPSGQNTQPKTPQPQELTPEQRRKSLKQGMINGTKNSVSSMRRFVRFLKGNGGKILMVFLALALLAGGLIYFNRVRHFRSFSTAWQVSATDSGYSDYFTLGDKIIHYSQDGVSALDLSGNIVWDQAFNMDVPAIAVKGSYFLIYDVKGKDYYICDTTGCTGYGTTEKKILKGDISAAGVVALVLDDKKCNYIDYYHKDGTKLDLEIKTLITGDGYPLDIAISPDGKELMTSYIYSSEGKMLSEVVFRNFEVGKNDADRVVGGFKEYEEVLVPDVMFFDDATSAAVTEKSIDFFSTKNALRPERVQTIEFEETICSVASDEGYVAVILGPKSGTEETEEETKSTKKSKKSDKDETEEAVEEGEKETRPQAVQYAYQLKVFDRNGKEVFHDTIDFPYSAMNFSGNGLFVYNTSTCAMYNMTGVCKFKGSLNLDIEGLMRVGERNIVAHGNGALQKITLK